MHRIGRTGRAGKEGIAITLVDWKDLQRWKLINDALGLDFAEPAETYSTSEHLYEALDIPAGITGTLPRAQRERAGLEAEEVEDIGETGRNRSPQRSEPQEHKPRKRNRARQRTRGGRPLDGEVDTTVTEAATDAEPTAPAETVTEKAEKPRSRTDRADPPGPSPRPARGRDRHRDRHRYRHRRDRRDTGGTGGTSGPARGAGLGDSHRRSGGGVHGTAGRPGSRRADAPVRGGAVQAQAQAPHPQWRSAQVSLTDVTRGVVTDRAPFSCPEP